MNKALSKYYTHLARHIIPLLVSIIATLIIFPVGMQTPKFSFLLILIPLGAVISIVYSQQSEAKTLQQKPNDEHEAINHFIQVKKKQILYYTIPAYVALICYWLTRDTLFLATFAAVLVLLALKTPFASHLSKYVANKS